MKINPQVIAQNGIPAFVVLPFDEYEQLMEIIEELEDIQTVKHELNSTSERFPLEVIEQIINGDNAIKVYRSYRGLSQTELAEAAGVTRQYISQLEHGERQGTSKLMKKIAGILQVDLDDII